MDERLAGYRAVLFDLDGVLTDTSEFHYFAWQRFCDEERIPFDRHRNEQLRGVHRADAMRGLLGDRDVIDFLKLSARSFVYSASLPVAQVAAAQAALDIIERQHADIQHCRDSVFYLVDYLRAQGIVHVVAHPLYGVNDRLSIEHFEKMLLLFKNFEMNGARNDVANDGLEAILKALSPEDHPVMITKPEFMRRMKEMQALQGMAMGDLPDHFNVIVNANHPLVAQKLVETEAGEAREALAGYLYKLALLNHGMLRGKELSDFIQQSIARL